MIMLRNCRPGFGQRFGPRPAAQATPPKALVVAGMNDVLNSQGCKQAASMEPDPDCPMGPDGC